jgi:CHASE2 domain-containing sensor protein
MWLRRLRLFVSYRRADSEASAGRLADALGRQFGARRVFLDTASMPLGLEFMRVLESQVARSDVVLVIIGPSWASLSNERGVRLHQEDDPVRFELVHAQQAGKRIVPVLIESASMPNAESLPEELRFIFDYTFHPVRNATFASDFDALVDGVLGRNRGRVATELDRLIAWVLGAGGSVLLVPALAFLVALGAWTGVFDYFGLDTRVQRALLRSSAPLGPSTVMIASIDAGTERALGRRWGDDPLPWRRGHADFINAAAASGARAVLFDLAFDCRNDPKCAPEPFEGMANAARRAAQGDPPMTVVFGVRARDGIEPLLAAPLRGVGKVGNVCMFDRGAGALFSAPLAILGSDSDGPVLAAHTPALAVLAIAERDLTQIDVDRRTLGFDGPPRSPPLGFSVVERRRDQTQKCTLISPGDLVASLAFVPSPDGYWRDAERRVGYEDVVTWHAGRPAPWRGRTLIVGVTAVQRPESNQDRADVLEGILGSRSVYGVELQADAASLLSTGRVLDTPTAGAQMVSAAAMALLGVSLAVAGRGWWPAARIAALALLVALWIAYSVQQAQHGRLLNPAYDVAALLLAYATLVAADRAARRFLYGSTTS